jgi:glutathione synthase/RimK-type ligase-like ATP-grasp enzyme
MKLLGIHRETLYSPERENDDTAILRLTAEALQTQGFDVQTKGIEEIRPSDLHQPIFAMCEGPQGIQFLKEAEARGHRVVNGSQAALNCHRWRMWPLLQKGGVPLPSTLIVETPRLNGAILPSKQLWIKRGDVHNTQDGGDVVYVDTDETIQRTLQNMASRGIEKALIQEHVDGDLIKFYGIIGSDWFKWFYHKGVSRGIPFDEKELRPIVDRAAKAMGLEIFGGDVIVASDRMVLIDINSWPSFALCRDEASKRIADYLERRFSK